MPCLIFFFRLIICAAFMLLYTFSARAQSPERRPPPTAEERQQLKSRMEEEYKAAKSDTARVRLQIQLASLTAPDNFNEGVKLGQEAVTLADKTGHSETIARACLAVAILYFTNNRYDNALEYLNKGLPAAKKTASIPLLQSYHNNLGMMYERKGIYEKALDFFHKSYEALEKMQAPPARRAGALMQIGQVQGRTGKYRESNESYTKALTLAEQLQDWEKVSGIWNNIGNNYNDLGDTARAEEAFAKSREYRERDKKKASSRPNPTSGNN